MISEDFPGFPRICATWSLNCFCFDFHISAEQFYDHNKQELGKTGENQTNKQCHVKWWLKYRNNRSVSWRLSCNTVDLAPLCTVVNGRYSRLVPIFLVPMSFINVSNVLICQFFNYSSHLFFPIPVIYWSLISLLNAVVYLLAIANSILLPQFSEFTFKKMNLLSKNIYMNTLFTLF